MSADVSECLDDFFAKKDKKKKTKKSKSVFTPDDFDPVIGKPIKTKSKSLSTKSADATAEATFKPEDTMKETSVLDDTTEKDADHKSVGEVDIKEVDLAPFLPLKSNALFSFLLRSCKISFHLQRRYCPACLNVGQFSHAKII